MKSQCICLSRKIVLSGCLCVEKMLKERINSIQLMYNF